MTNDLINLLRHRDTMKGKLMSLGKALKEDGPCDLGDVQVVSLHIRMHMETLTEYCHIILIGPDKVSYRVVCPVEDLLDCRNLQEIVVKALSR